MCNKAIYRLNDDISFRICSLRGATRINSMLNPHMEPGDCTNYQEQEEKFKPVFYCKQEGIHFHCTSCPPVEMSEETDDEGSLFLVCPRCKKRFQVQNKRELISRCLKLLNIEQFKDAKLIRLDDWYVHEIKQKEKLPSDYFLTTEVKTDKDGDTMIVLYVGHKGTNEKAQLFIKPEKLQLSSDHKDMDPAKVLAKIEVTLKDRTLMQQYDAE